MQTGDFLLPNVTLPKHSIVPIFFVSSSALASECIALSSSRLLYNERMHPREHEWGLINDKKNPTPKKATFAHNSFQEWWPADRYIDIVPLGLISFASSHERERLVLPTMISFRVCFVLSAGQPRGRFYCSDYGVITSGSVDHGSSLAH